MEYALALNMQKGEINKIVGGNLRRLRNLKGYHQEELAELLRVKPSHISEIETGKRGIGKELMARICNVFNIRFSELTIEDSTPIIKDETEKEIIFILREAKRLGIAEEISKYGKYLIQEIKKTKKVPGEGKTLRYKAVKRR